LSRKDKGVGMNKLVAGVKAKPVLALWFAINILGAIAIVALGGYKIAIYQSPLHLIWFIPMCIIVAIIAVRDGLKVHMSVRSKLNE
jgi:hypothetical protein